MAVNSADDFINPPELEILEREIKHVKKGRYVSSRSLTRPTAMALTRTRRLGRVSADLMRRSQ